MGPKANGHALATIRRRKVSVASASSHRPRVSVARDASTHLSSARTALARLILGGCYAYVGQSCLRH
jgi:hypothetical protein